MAHDLVDLCFRLMLILRRKVCKWSEACNCWLALSLPNTWSMRWARYAMMLSECLLLGLFIDNGPNTWFCWLFRWVEWKELIPPEELWRKGSEILNLRTVSMILNSMQVNREILKVAPLELGWGGLSAGGFRVLMMFDLYFLIFPTKQKEVFFRQSCINFHV